MPVRKVYQNGKLVGYQWGTTGKVYPTQQQAETQGRAIYSSGYRPNEKKDKK